MPGHFTHIYTARRVAEQLLQGDFPDWPDEASGILRYKPQKCGSVMQTYEKFTAIGAVGPDLFYFSQDYNSEPAGPHSDDIMLALAVYYYFDAAKEDDWEPLLIILDGVSSTLAALLRLLIKLQKMWQAFVDGWNRTIGPLVAQPSNLLDALTGGLLNEFGAVLDAFKVALQEIVTEELLTYKDIFSRFNTCVQEGFGEKLFLWSDMSHYRRPSALCQAFVEQVHDLETAGETEKADQFLAFTLGYITHLATDTVAHSFVNEQCGGPFRNHPQRHHLIECHIDAWNYAETRPGGRNQPDPWGYTATYPDASMSALWFAVQIEADNPFGKQRPPVLPDDPADRKKALDVDGEMPSWMAECIVKAMISAFQRHDHPQIFQGSDFQDRIDGNMLTGAIEWVTGSGPDKPLPELLAGIAPTPSFRVPVGFPLPWQVQTMYRIMITYYKLSFKGNWELQKPRKPDFIILPPASDFENLLQPPDFSGVDSSNPLVDACEVFIALADWALKTLEAAGQLVEDLIKMAASPGSYLLREGLYLLAMLAWDIATRTHEILSHTAFMMPHGQQDYPEDDELRLPNEIDWPLITLGDTVDDAFRAALADALDPMGNLDQNQSVIGASHPVPDDAYPYYPVLKYDSYAPGAASAGFEFHRPWAYPAWSVVGDAKSPVNTPTESYSPLRSFGQGPDVFRTMLAGPYPAGSQPDVFFRPGAPVDPGVRSDYESAQTPLETDKLNDTYIGAQRRLRYSPLGDPIPFSAHLIAQLVNETGYSTQFNLDSDRAFAYLTWDWIRTDQTEKGILGIPYNKVVEPPAGATGWANGTRPLQLKYVDPPAPRRPPTPQSTERRTREVPTTGDAR